MEDGGWGGLTDSEGTVSKGGGIPQSPVIGKAVPRRRNVCWAEAPAEKLCSMKWALR